MESTTIQPGDLWNFIVKIAMSRVDEIMKDQYLIYILLSFILILISLILNCCCRCFLRKNIKFELGNSICTKQNIQISIGTNEEIMKELINILKNPKIKDKDKILAMKPLLSQKILPPRVRKKKNARVYKGTQFFNKGRVCI